jgi:uncharacterized membrane protein YfcA
MPEIGLATPTLLVMGVFLLASTVQAAIGFGSALVAMPLLVFVIDIQTATGVVGLVVLAISALMLLGSWRKVAIRDGWQLVVSAILGIPVGLLLLRGGSETVVKGVLGALLIAFGLYRLISPSMPALRGPRWLWLWLSGFTAGILGGAYNTNGPPIVVYGAMRRWPPDEFRATMPMVFLSTGVFIAAGQGLAGLWTPTALRLVLYALPAVAVGTFIGIRLGRRIPAAIFSRIVYGLLIVMGVFLLV